MVRDWLHSTNPYQGFRGKPKKGPNWGGGAPIFKELIEQVKPRLIIEVGSFYGDSAITMAQLADCEVVAVDTWLGTMDGMRPDHPDYVWHERKHGFPQLYWRFLANVIEAGVQDKVTPFPQTSVNAARAMAKQGVKADLIYIDAAHEAEDVEADLRAYAPLLSKRGVMFGHDWNHENVRRGVNRFGWNVHPEGEFYILSRP